MKYSYAFVFAFGTAVIFSLTACSFATDKFRFNCTPGFYIAPVKKTKAPVQNISDKNVPSDKKRSRSEPPVK